MVEEIPLHHIEIAFADFLAITVAIGIVLADAGRATDCSTVLEGFGHKLLGAGIGDQSQSIPVRTGERGRITRLQPRMDVERRSGERTQGRGDRRPQGHVEMAEAEDLHLERVTRHARMTSGSWQTACACPPCPRKWDRKSD